jgi:hypothetical protein
MYLPFEGEKTTWHEGFERFDYVMEEDSFAITPFKRPEGEKFAVGNPAKGQRRCIVVVPKKIATGSGRKGAATGTTSRRQKSNCSGAVFTSPSSRQTLVSSGSVV